MAQEQLFLSPPISPQSSTNSKSQVYENYIHVDCLKETFECPSCNYYPRPYLAVALCKNMHKVCGLCFSQFNAKNKTKCILCTESYKTFPTIYGFHDVMEILNEKVKFSCMQSFYGCPETELRVDNVLEHDRNCTFALFKCSKKNCTVLFPWKDLLTVKHPEHVSPVFKTTQAPSWNFFVPFSKLYDRLEQTTKLCKRVPIFPLIKSSETSLVDPLFRPVVHFRFIPNHIYILIYWQSVPFLANENVSLLKFQITAYLNTLYGSFILGTSIISPNFVNQNPLNIFTIPEWALENAQSHIHTSNCIECLFKYPHIHFSVNEIN